ncbi:MAG: hypothetical protein WCB47_14620, partial [Pseudolabrys sp.]
MIKTADRRAFAAMSALGHKQTFAVQKGMSALPRKRSALGDCRIFLDAFVIGDQPEGKAKDHSDVVYNQNDNPQSAARVFLMDESNKSPLEL